MSALGWLRTRAARDYEKRRSEIAAVGAAVGRVPLVMLNGEAVPEADRPLTIIAPVDLEAFAARIQDAVIASSVTPWPKAGPGECLCCVGRYSTCRNLT